MLNNQQLLFWFNSLTSGWHWRWNCHTRCLKWWKWKLSTLTKLTTPVSLLSWHVSTSSNLQFWWCRQERSSKLFCVSVLSRSVCINWEVFIYIVRINVALKSITSWESSTLTGHRSSSINSFHPHFLHHSALVVHTISPPCKIDGCYFLSSCFRHLTRLTVSLETPTLFSVFASLVSISRSFFPSRPEDTTSDLQFENYCACHLVAVNICWTSPFPSCNTFDWETNIFCQYILVP